MQRVKDILIKYNISFDRLKWLLESYDKNLDIRITSKIDDKIFELVLEKYFDKDRIVKSFANKTLNEFYQKTNNLTNNALKDIPKGYSKRIRIYENSNYTFNQIFGDCFWGAKKIICIDPYLRNKKQIQNLESLINLIKRFSSNKIIFKVITTYDELDDDSFTTINDLLNDIEKKFTIPNVDLFDFSYSIEKPKSFHDRSIQVDNKYIIDLSRGLDIFHKSLDFYDDFNIKPSMKAKTKETTIFITRLT